LQDDFYNPLSRFPGFPYPAYESIASRTLAAKLSAVNGSTWDNLSAPAWEEHIAEEFARK